MRLVAYSDATVRGGAEQTLGTLLAALDPSVDVTVLGVEASVVDWIAERRPGASTHLVPPVGNKADAAAIRAHLRAVRDLRPDILHVNLATPWGGQYAQLAGLLARGVRVVAVENSPIRSSDRLQILAKRALSRRIDAHVACGAWLGHEIERMVGLPAGRVRVVHNGIPEVLPDPVCGLPPGLVVGTVGRLTREKGFDLLIRAAAKVPGFSLVIVGAGEEQERLAALAEDLGIGDRVVLTGWVADSRAWLRGFDVFVLPSLIEGFPLTTLEAMLAGVPVVASDVGGVGEAVREGQTGRLVPSGDVDALAAAIASLVDDPGTRAALGTRGRQVVLAEFTAGRMAARYEALYRELLAR